MRDRVPLILSATALVVSVLGATPLGEAAYNAVVPNNSVVGHGQSLALPIQLPERKALTTLTSKTGMTTAHTTVTT